jgi:hypothetical protein
MRSSGLGYQWGLAGIANVTIVALALLLAGGDDVYRLIRSMARHPEFTMQL